MQTAAETAMLLAEPVRMLETEKVWSEYDSRARKRVWYIRVPDTHGVRRSETLPGALRAIGRYDIATVVEFTR